MDKVLKNYWKLAISAPLYRLVLQPDVNLLCYWVYSDSLNVTITFHGVFHDGVEHNKGNISLDQAVCKVPWALCGGETAARYGRTSVLMFLESSNYHCNAAYNRYSSLLWSRLFQKHGENGKSYSSRNVLSAGFSMFIKENIASEFLFFSSHFHTR
jgi:hypothetical protein